MHKPKSIQKMRHTIGSPNSGKKIRLRNIHINKHFIDYLLRSLLVLLSIYKGNLRGKVANVLDCDIVVSEFELRSCYYVYFRTNTRGKGMNHLNPTAMG